MHNKSFFQGLGLGLVIASVLFLILYSTRAKEGKPTETDMQTAEAEVSAESTTSMLDLPDGEADEAPVGEVKEIEGDVGEAENIDMPPEPVIEELEPPDGLSSEVAQIEDRDMSVPSLSENAENSQAEDEALEEREPEMVHVTIKSGDRASDVCHKLYAAGAIDSEKGFSDFMRVNGYSRKVLYGNFDIPKGASYREVYDIIKSH